MRYTTSTYANTLPRDIQKGVRQSVSRTLRREVVEYPVASGRFRAYSKLTTAQRSEVLDEIMTNRLCDIEGVDARYWSEKANGLR